MTHSTWHTRKTRTIEETEVGSKARAVLDETELAMRIGTAIYQLRTARGCSQSELARRAGMRQPAIARLETSLTLPSMLTMLRVANAFGEDPTALLHERLVA